MRGRDDGWRRVVAVLALAAVALAAPPLRAEPEPGATLADVLSRCDGPSARRAPFDDGFCRGLVLGALAVAQANCASMARGYRPDPALSAGGGGEMSGYAGLLDVGGSWPRRSDPPAAWLGRAVSAENPCPTR
jgi:hypothetical protein